jgi:integrase
VDLLPRASHFVTGTLLLRYADFPERIGCSNKYFKIIYLLQEDQLLCEPQFVDKSFCIIWLPPRDSNLTDRIFSGERMSPENVSLTFSLACRTAHVVDFRFHDLRHTEASWMRMSGADIHTAALILGHKDLRMAARYQHLSPAFLSDAVKLLDSAFAETSS